MSLKHNPTRKQSDNVLMKPESKVFFIRGISNEVHHQFKSFCAKRGISMNKMLMRLIKRAIKEDQI